MLIVDGHLDLALNAIKENRDLLVNVWTTRVRESHETAKGKGKSTVSLDEMRSGRVALCFTTAHAFATTGRFIPHMDFGSPEQAFAVARGQLAYYEALERQGHARIIRCLEDLDGHMDEWTQWDAGDTPDPATSPPLGLVVNMECADAVLDPGQLEDWWNWGLRLIGPAHSAEGRYAGGTGSASGLTSLGPPLLAEMQRLGIPLDLTHCSDASFWECLQHYEGPVLASHCNSRTLVPHQRELDDAQIQAILDRNGVIGVTLGNWQLQYEWKCLGDNRHLRVMLDRAVDHIDYICQMAGDHRHVAIGSDLDGGVGTDEFPADLDTIADLQRFTEILDKRGYSAEATAAILNGNWLRFLRDAWGE
ncbi:MAG: membrane dipeptidase [Planctomycetota bacterium]|nr:membrane dipeptidase [Planctomycetota bacterium]MEE3366197.1 membrane dipeptidase [Planctomycetota bacterium]